jgi:hypothetical protein
VASGVDFKIASFGKYEVIQAYCDRAFGKGTLTRADVSTPTEVGGKDGCSVEGGKNLQIEKFCLEKYGASWSVDMRRKVVLFDDDSRNVEAAQKAGFRAVHTPDGFTKAATKSVFDQLCRRRRGDDS